MAQGVPARLTRAEGRKFGFTLAPAFLALGGLLAWRGHTLPAGIAAAAGVLFGLSALAVPDRLGPVQRAWMAFAHAISRITTPVFLGIVWFIIITPIGWIRRLASNPIVHADRDGGYWIRRDEGGAGARSDLKRQF
ncbi:MAG: SxtJ family membrane protein [Gemmatimonadetes bacterium]|nr:SxtJ family membrane protein [Gemmatimonadota bacterium]